MSKRILSNEIREAYEKIKGDVYKTPLEYSPELSRISGANVFLKLENQQKTGSFKIRGVYNKLRNLHPDVFHKPFVAASTGNHAAAFAYASREFGFKGHLFMPEDVREVKRKALDSYDLDIQLYGKSSKETEAKATDFAIANDGILIHPYNDEDIIKGQGSIAVEIHDEFPQLDAVLAPIGGGGLISGLCSYFQDTVVEVIGCQPSNACEMYQSVQENRIIEPSDKTTIADATAGGMEDDSLTFEICKQSLSGFEILDEEQIKRAVAFMLAYHQIMIEAGAALPVAAVLNSQAYRGKNIALVLTGKKMNPELLKEIVLSYGNGIE